MSDIRSFFSGKKPAQNYFEGTAAKTISKDSKEQEIAFKIEKKQNDLNVANLNNTVVNTQLHQQIPVDVQEIITWQAGKPVPYLSMVETFEEISKVSGRIEKENILSRLFRAVICTTPSDLDVIVYLASNEVSPVYDGMELGIGDSLLVKAVCEATGRKRDAVEEAYEKEGDLGTVALISRANQKTLSFAAKPKALMAREVLEQFRLITQTKGEKAQGRKVEIIKALMVKCQGSEAKFIVRALQGKLRIGTAQQTVLVALAHAVADTQQQQLMSMLDRENKEEDSDAMLTMLAEDAEAWTSSGCKNISNVAALISCDDISRNQINCDCTRINNKKKKVSSTTTTTTALSSSSASLLVKGNKATGVDSRRRKVIDDDEEEEAEFDDEENKEAESVQDDVVASSEKKEENDNDDENIKQISTTLAVHEELASILHQKTTSNIVNEEKMNDKIGSDNNDANVVAATLVDAATVSDIVGSSHTENMQLITSSLPASLIAASTVVMEAEEQENESCMPLSILIDRIQRKETPEGEKLRLYTCAVFCAILSYNNNNKKKRSNNEVDDDITEEEEESNSSNEITASTAAAALRAIAAANHQLPKEARWLCSEIAVKRAFSECPNLSFLVKYILSYPLHRLHQVCCLNIGIPVAPMLAKPTKQIGEVLKRLSGLAFTMEYKYDGERAQVHLLPDGTVKIFSRNSEDNSEKYPDLRDVVRQAKMPEVTSCILDAEVVAYDREQRCLLPFQVLSTRKRKVEAGEEENQKVKVILQIFDLLYLNGKSCLRESLRVRRALMRASFNHSEALLHFASGLDHVENGDTAPIELFLQEACAAQCEGLMVKTLDDNASYEPSKRSLNWLKLKKDYIEGMGVCDSVDLVVIGGYYGRGKRTSVYGAYLMACYDADRDEYQSVCKVGTGFKDEDLQRLYTEMNALVIGSHKRPLNYNVSEALTPDDWFQCSKVWELQAADLSKSSVHTGAVGRVDSSNGGGGDTGRGIGLRFPRYLKDREDKKPEMATSAEQIAEMYYSQQGATGSNTAGITGDDAEDDDWL